MARTIRTKVFKFNELNEDAKQKAIESFYDINVNDEWWIYTYEDAENIGLKITSFDIDRGSYCKGEFLLPAFDVSCKIIQEHGVNCETHKTALKFGADWTELVKKYSDGIELDKVTYDNEYDFDNEANDLEDEFKQSLLEDYRIILQKEYEYQTSEAAIIETIEANDYEFTADGRQF